MKNPRLSPKQLELLRTLSENGFKEPNKLELKRKNNLLRSAYALENRGLAIVSFEFNRFWVQEREED